MSTPLPRLRHNLDFLPSPSPEHPGLFIRDPFRYSDALLIIPPPLVECLACFDGQHTDLDLRAFLVKATNDLQVGDLERHLVEVLSGAGFLEDENFSNMEIERRTGFAEAAVREAAHAGAAYPAEPDALREALAAYLGSTADGAGGRGRLMGIAAPHVTPEGGAESYAAAYRMVGPEHRDRTFVILGTSHFGEADRFGLTRKNFVTPLGEAVNDRGMVDWLEKRGGKAVEMEDYCHSFEHTVEFQVVFLQHAVGPGVRILPILCGSFANSIYRGGKPESADGVKAFLDALGELNDREGEKLFWVLGVDMAHMGVRYGDGFEAAAGQGVMSRVEARDNARIDRINNADADGFWGLVQENQDDLKWCGSSPFYTFLKSVPNARGDLLHYGQWNIDEKSVVSFAGMAFRKDG